MAKKKNITGGSRHKRAKNSDALQSEKLVMREDDTLQHYAYVKKSYGNGWFGVFLVCSDGGTLGLTTKEYRARVSGRMRKQKWRNFVLIGGLVLISIRDFQTNDDKVDIVHVYKDDAVRKLVKMGEVPSVDNMDGDNGVELLDTVMFVDDEAEDAVKTIGSVEGGCSLSTIQEQCGEGGDCGGGCEGADGTDGTDGLTNAMKAASFAKAAHHQKTVAKPQESKMGWGIDVDDI